MMIAERAFKFEPGAEAPPKPANDNFGIKLLSFVEFKAQENGTAEAMIKGLVRIGTLIAIGGRPGAGKTALMLAIAAALDAGEPFLGRETKSSTIAYVAAEDGGDVANRLEAMGNHRIKIAKLPEGLPLTKPARAAEIAREIIRQARLLNPGRPILLVVDTLRAALGGVSVLDDKVTSPDLNALREVAEIEGAVVAILNHTNRENNQATKGGTLEAVAALELVLLEDKDSWFTIYVGKNRSGPGHVNIGSVRYTSAEVGDVTAAIVDEMTVDTQGQDHSKERRPTPDQQLMLSIIQTAILDAKEYRTPFGDDGPRVKVAKESDVRDQYYKRKAGNITAKRVSFNRQLNYWIAQGKIVRGEEGKKRTSLVCQGRR